MQIDASLKSERDQGFGNVQQVEALLERITEGVDTFRALLRRQVDFTKASPSLYREHELYLRRVAAALELFAQNFDRKSSPKPRPASTSHTEPYDDAIERAIEGL